MEDFTYESLWQAVYKEKKTNELQILSRTFYQDVKKYIGTLKGTNAGEADETKLNAIRLLEELFGKRKQKILIYVAHNKTLPEPTVPLELSFYEKVRKEYGEATVDGFEEAMPHKEELYVNKDFPEIILPSGTRIGPYKKGDRLELENEEDTNFLKSTEICVNRNG